MTVSSPMVGKMCVHLLQQSGWKSRCCCIHSSKAGWLAKKACYRPPRPFFFFLLFFSPRHKHFPTPQQHSVSSTSPRASWPPCNEETSSAVLFLLKDSGEDKQAQVVVCSGAKTSWSWKSNAFPSSQSRWPCSVGAVQLLQEVNLKSPKTEII